MRRNRDKTFWDRRFFNYLAIAAGGLVLLIAIAIGTLDYVLTATHDESVTVGVNFSHYYCGNADCCQRCYETVAKPPV